MNLTEVIKILGEPYFQSNQCLIYNLDCLEALKKIPADSFPLTITSPPYNIGKEYEECLPIKASSNPGDLILDPFLGSGTTAIAALTLNRSVIGFEIKPEYCEIATQRIKNYLETMNIIQPSLFPLLYT